MKKLLELLKENRKPLFFLLRFIGMFGVLSLAYAFWLESYGLQPDSFTRMVGQHLQVLFQQQLLLADLEQHAAIAIEYKGQYAVSLFEGCNGLAVMILFVSFVFAFKGQWKDLLWFIPIGLLIIHLFNLARLSALIWLSSYNSQWFHFTHKYLFTLIIYAGVFLLWVWWVSRIIRSKKTTNPSTHAV